MDGMWRAGWTRRKAQAMQRIVEHLQRRPARSQRSRRSINLSSDRGNVLVQTFGIPWTVSPVLNGDDCPRNPSGLH